MTRTHRTAHRLIWLLLAVAVGVALLLALLWRAPAHAGLPPPPAAGDAR